jgi:hypothetical protein
VPAITEPSLSHSSVVCVAAHAALQVTVTGLKVPAEVSTDRVACVPHRLPWKGTPAAVPVRGVLGPAQSTSIPLGGTAGALTLICSPFLNG